MVKYYQIALQNAALVNAKILQQYQQLEHDPEVTRSHFFEGRYENVYIEQGKIPALGPVLAAAKREAMNYLGETFPDLAIGFWFNEMGPGTSTLAHRHDEDDELASATYYVQVPENSGNLELGEGDEKVVITPAAGEFIFFEPDVVHCVSRNLSDQIRLSIGMNFGRRL